MHAAHARALLSGTHAAQVFMVRVSHPPADTEDALLLQELLDPYSTGSRLLQVKAEDYMSIFPTYSEADAMLNRRARAKRGTPLAPSQSMNFYYKTLRP